LQSSHRCSDSSSTLIYECAHEDDEHKWHILRIGPISMHGGQNFSCDQLHSDIFDFRNTTSDSYVTATFGSAIHDNDNFSVPHFHLHHFDLYVQHPANTNLVQFLTKNQCNTCRSAHGGAECLFQSMPEGYGQSIHPGTRLYVNAFVNDIRKCQNRRDLYLEMALGITSSVVRRDLTYVAVRAPEWQWYPPIDSPSLWPVGGSFLIRRHFLYIMWSAAPFLFDGEVTWVHVHTHRQSEKRVLVYGASPETLGLNRGSYKIVEPWALPLNISTSQFETTLNVPHGTPHCRSNEAIPFESLNGDFIDRDDMLVCTRKWVFRQRSAVTTICMFQMPSHLQQSAMGQHCTLHMLVSPNDDMPLGRLQYVPTWFGSTHVERAYHRQQKSFTSRRTKVSGPEVPTRYIRPVARD